MEGGCSRSFVETRHDVNEKVIRKTAVVAEESDGTETHTWERNGKIVSSKKFSAQSVVLLQHVLAEVDWYSDHACAEYIYGWHNVASITEAFYDALRFGRKRALYALHSCGVPLPDANCESDAALHQFRSPLIHYCISNATVLLALLKLYPRINVNATCPRTGNTALHNTRCSEVVKVLLNAGACPYILNNAGKTPREAIYCSASGLHFLSPLVGLHCIDCITTLQEHEDAAIKSRQKSYLLQAILSPQGSGSRLKIVKCRDITCRRCEFVSFSLLN